MWCWLSRTISKLFQLLKRSALMMPSISLADGYATFAAPPIAMEALRQAVSADRLRFGPPEGILELREAISARYRRQYGVEVNPATIVITPGAKFGLHALLRTLLRTGDEVLIPTPNWAGLVDLVRDAGGSLNLLPLDESDGYALSPTQLAAAITPQTRIILLTNPNNPTGRIYTKAEIAALLAVTAQWPDLYFISDEIYDGLTYDGARVPSLAEWPDSRERHVIVHGFSKSLAMPGWHVGYVVAPPAIAKAMADYQRRTVSSAAVIYQHGAIAVTNSFENITAELLPQLIFNRQLLLDGLAQIGVTVFAPQGGYFVFADLRPWLPLDQDPIAGSATLVNFLRAETGLIVLDGALFGTPGFVRMLFATSVADLREALRRLAGGLRRMKA